jgi:N-methylhydantoinase B
MQPVDVVELSLFASRIDALCEEMGAHLRRAAFSPNIRDRLDYSCAIFDADGALCAQAAHIPVHLGSMAYAMGGLVERMDWAPGDMVVLNDPFLGGTHLPDVTLIAPVFVQGRRVAFVANRAHHADIGAESPGSMPISRSLDEEGLLIPPMHLLRAGALDTAALAGIAEASRNPEDARGDLSAQIAANRRGLQRLGDWIEDLGVAQWSRRLLQLNDYAERMTRSTLGALPDGEWRFVEYLDDDGLGREDIALSLSLRLRDEGAVLDFAGTAAQVPGNVNCPLSVTAAGIYYAFRCLLPAGAPACAGGFRPIELRVPQGCLLNAERPAAVAAGNVETSTRVVDLVLGALAQALPERIPAASQGSMNNLALGAGGSRPWGYYETVGGGMGAGMHGGGLCGVQTHMTNTRNTPVEVLELRYPLRVRRYALRDGSGGAGRRRGGDGLLREYEFLAPARFTLLSERRRHAPWGLAGGAPGRTGAAWLNEERLPGKVSRMAAPGDRLLLETPGGGGWGAAGAAG